MPRSARQQSVSDHYHVTQRGSGKRCIFEDDDDRRSFVRTMAYFSRDCQVRLIAWVLMDNHFHLLLRAELEDLSRFMSRLGTVHAQRFNGAHGHVGCVFQGRFKSIPIETDPQLLATIRYIHLNPLETGVTRLEDYPWSSYPQYLGARGICDTSLMTSLVGGRERIIAFHEASCADALVSLDGHRPRMDDAEALANVQQTFGASFLDSIVRMDHAERDRALKRLHRLGLSGAQITRLTGFGRGIVQRACTQKRS